MSKLQDLVTQLESARDRVRQDPEEEAVHKLRTSIRRLQAGVRALKKTVKLAGEVRERDIAVKLLAEEQLATDEILRERHHHAAELLAGIQPGPPVEDLIQAVEDYFDAGDKAFRRKIPWDKLHKFRLESKHIRYTLELHADEYGKPMEKLLKELKKVQTYLGDINDLIATQALLKGHTAFKKALKVRADEQMAEMRTYWMEQFTVQRTAWLATVAKPKVTSRKRTR